MTSIAVLFARADSIYKTMPECDVYDIERDARTWPGGCPVVAHPPCKRWSPLNNLVLVRYPHRAAEFAHGNDGGLFELAVSHVRQYGGVLEHPAQSRAWSKFHLPRPGAGRWQRGICGGWSIEIDQASFGHPARKTTWLYAVCDTPPAAPPAASFSRRVVRVRRVRNVDGTWSRTPASENESEISHKAAEATPAAFARWLVDLAMRCKVTEAA